MVLTNGISYGDSGYKILHSCLSIITGWELFGGEDGKVKCEMSSDVTLVRASWIAAYLTWQWAIKLIANVQREFTSLIHSAGFSTLEQIGVVLRTTL